jgi:hypothetical protein
MSGRCEKCSEHCLECKCSSIPSFFTEGLALQIPKILTDEEERVNHPSHYQGNQFEVIDIIEDFDLNFSMGNAIKYILRAGKKEDRIEDLKKAVWYLEREISK